MQFESHLGHSVIAGGARYGFLLLTKLDLLSSGARQATVGIRGILSWTGTALTKESVSGGDIFKGVAQAARFSW